MIGASSGFSSGSIRETRAMRSKTLLFAWGGRLIRTFAYYFGVVPANWSASRALSRETNSSPSSRPIPADRRFVDVHPKARRLGQRHMAVAQRQRLPNQVLDEIEVGEAHAPVDRRHPAGEVDGGR